MKKTLTILSLAASVICAGAELPPNGSFDAKARDGKIPHWTTENGVLVPGFKGNAVEVTPDMVQGNTLLRQTLKCKLGKVAPGQYMLSGVCRDAFALWIVVQFDRVGNKIPPFKVWLGKAKFRPTDKEGWISFSAKVEVPKKAEDCTLIIEPLIRKDGKDNPKVALDEIKLEPMDE